MSSEFNKKSSFFVSCNKRLTSKWFVVCVVELKNFAQLGGGEGGFVFVWFSQSIFIQIMIT